MKKIIKVTSLLLALVALSGCDKALSLENNHFGDFSYNGIFLNDYAKKQITVEEAKDLVDLNVNASKRRGPSESVQTLLTSYASLVTRLV